MALINADLRNVQAQESFDPIPPGSYQVTITDSSVVYTKTKNEPMLKVTMTVADGQFHGRKVFDNFLLGNAVAASRMKAMASAANHPHPDFIADSEELHGLKLVIAVKVQTDSTGNYPPQNKVTSFKKIEGTAAPLQAPAPAALVFAPPPPVAPKPPMQFAAPAPVAPPAAAPAPAAAPVPAKPTNALPWA